MTPEALSLIDRRLDRIKKDHIGDLSTTLQNALQLIDPHRKITITNGIDAFRKRTAVAQTSYGIKLHSEVFLVVEKINQSQFDKIAKASILQVTQVHLNDELYDHRFQGYAEAVKRHLGRQGVNIDLSLFGSDLAEALYKAHSANFVRSTFGQLSDDLEILVHSIAQTSSPTQSNDKINMCSESKLEQANKFFRLEPNIFGFGFNFNYLIRRLIGKKE